MPSKGCPICGDDKCTQSINPNNITRINCQSYGLAFDIDTGILENEYGQDVCEKGLDLILEKLIRKPRYEARGNTKPWFFYYDPDNMDSAQETDKEYYINIAKYLITYPNTITEVTNRALMNLSIKHPKYGDHFLLHPEDDRLIFEHGREYFTPALFGNYIMLNDLGYIKTKGNDSLAYITAEGWKKISELQEKESIIRQGFVAIKYGDETQAIRKAICAGIEAAHFGHCVMDEKQHNNEIVPEMLFEISRSMFLVMDVSIESCGAYYEAGFAQALGKEVIICCREKEYYDETKRPHFDVAQRPIIIWKNEEDLVERLKKRIEATVG